MKTNLNVVNSSAWLVQLSILCLVFAAVPVWAQASVFEFRVADQVKSEIVDLTYHYGVEVTEIETGHYRFHFNLNCAVNGLRRDSFSYVREQFSGDLPSDQWEEFRKEIRKLPLDELIKGIARTSSGTILIDGVTRKIVAMPESEARKTWKRFLDAFVRKNPADWSLGKTTRKIEGETAKPLDLTVAEIVANPGKFDGKRVRLTGFYHGEFECSVFVPSARHMKDFRNGIWFCGNSTFSDPDEVVIDNNIMVVVEGTFSNQPGSMGHGGIFVGGMTLVSSIRRVSSPAPGVNNATEED